MSKEKTGVVAKVIELVKKYKEVLLYLIFGALTTAVNVVTFVVCRQVLGWEVMPATYLAWAAAVLFAYLTNRKWVFSSTAKGAEEVFREFASFIACRIGTGVLDFLIMFIFVEQLGWKGDIRETMVKLASNIIVIIVNYIASKLVIFRDRSKGPKVKSEEAATESAVSKEE